jgi:DNA polymerase III delta prime subunit
LEAKRLKEKEEEGDQSNSKKSKRVEEEEEEEGKKVILISESDKKGKNLVVDIEEEEKVERVKGVMADDSGGLSANKAGAQEEEGSTAPFPDKVCMFFCFYFYFVADLIFCYRGLLYFVVILLIYRV